MSKTPNYELLSRAQRIRAGDGDFMKCFHLYNRFHAGEEGCEVLADDFVIFSSVAQELIELGRFLQEHPEVIVDDIYGTYSKLKAGRQSTEE
jgi:hypothetical protein